jgi:hypothetical protein
MRSNKEDQQNRYNKGRVPHFDSGIISEPLIAFGQQHQHVDPKTGLALYGPYSLVGQDSSILKSITVGVVGPPQMLADAIAWLQACKGVLSNDGSQPFLYPHFPGFNTDRPFNCDMVFGESLREPIKEMMLKAALLEKDRAKRLKNVIDLYVEALQVLAGRDPKPQVVLCCIPQDVIDRCTTPEQSFQLRRTKQAKARVRPNNQFSLFGDDATLGIEEDETVHQNLRRGLKAEAMKVGIPTQLVWPRTLRISDSDSGSGQLRTQDIATRAWNFTTALYHKGGGSPWRLAEIEPGVCFVGISFYREIAGDNPHMRTSMAQAFTAAGDGYVLRGKTFEWDEKRGKSPHLERQFAASLLRDVIELYQKQNRNALPTRLVVHKSSRYTADELAGFQEACEILPRSDLVTLGTRGLQFYRTGDYPPIRGTYVKFGASDLLLYTSGYVPFLRTYPGPRVPQPLEIMEHFGDSPWDLVLREVLALTKMNWNTADFSCSAPITIAFSRRVGQILAELPVGAQIRPEYRFYM